MRHIPKTTLAAALATLATPSFAQNLLVNDIGGAYLEIAAISPLFPTANAPLAQYFHTIPFGPPPSFPGPEGGIAVDGLTGLLWYSDGTGVASELHQGYPASQAVPFPPFPVPMSLGFAGIVTGVAVDASSGHLWMTDGATVGAVLADASGTLAIPSFAPNLSGTPQLTGLDFDPITGTLWGCDASGMAYNFSASTGAAVGSPMAPPSTFIGPATGITIDTTGNTSAGGMRYLYVIGAGTIGEFATGTLFPTFADIPGIENGIVFSPSPSITPAFPPCVCPGSTPLRVLTDGPTTIANSAWSAIVVGASPGDPVIYGFDFAGFDPMFPSLNPTGCPFGLNVSTAVGIVVAADSNGVARLPVALDTVPAGFTFYLQHALPCTTNSILPVVLTPLHQIVVSVP